MFTLFITFVSDVTLTYGASKQTRVTDAVLTSGPWHPSSQGHTHSYTNNLLSIMTLYNFVRYIVGSVSVLSVWQEYDGYSCHLVGPLADMTCTGQPPKEYAPLYTPSPPIAHTRQWHRQQQRGQDLNGRGRVWRSKAHHTCPKCWVLIRNFRHDAWKQSSRTCTLVE